MADASAIVHALTDEGEASRALDRGIIAVPHLADVEVASAFRGRLQRGEMSEDAIVDALAKWAQFGCTRYQVTGLLPRIWELRDNVNPYDAAYVALAETFQCDLLTADLRLAEATGPRCGFAIVRS